MANRLYIATVNGKTKGQALSFIPPSITNIHGLPSSLIIGYQYENKNNENSLLTEFKPNIAFMETIQEFCKSVLIKNIKEKDRKLSNNEYLYIIDQRNINSDKPEDIIGAIKKSDENDVEFQANPNYVPLSKSGPISFGEMDEAFYKFMIDKISN